ncbi:alpha/beta fold hydrolase [Nocardia stercoris]|uniref:Alpha/beta hydrolase n=1 Tax=Nocardia stercoris TaxID=2483361 RepID=A0A3M2L2G0_9NOCA|nr:alpha/beta hydrolase [Nocardia stercoris]RMI30713.1 alpha/beta hydrolase [Nocardia stercoris]
MTDPARRTRVLDRSGVVLRGEEAGDGPTVLLLHAGGEDRAVWQPVIDVLVGAGLRCVAFDQRGHGASGGSADTLEPCAADVAALVCAEPAGCVLVGASLGGYAALAALEATAVRERVAGLILVDVPLSFDLDRVVGTANARGLDDTRIVADIHTHIPRLQRIVAALDLPITLVRGGRRSWVADDRVAELLRLAPHAEVVPIPGAGHLVARDCPAALAETVAAQATTWPALALLRELGAHTVDHPGGNLLDHLRRVHAALGARGARPATCLAGLCHATYGTDGFPHPLLPLTERDRLRAAIGAEAEAIVYRYAACDRAATYAALGTHPLPLTDRFTGGTTVLTDTEFADFALLTIVNELDVAEHADLTPEVRQGIGALVDALSVRVPPGADGNSPAPA